MMIIREEQGGDQRGIRIVNELAFGRIAEANLVAALWQGDPAIVSLVALQQAQIVGHVMFSRVAILTDHQDILGMGLGPLAVLPAWQRQGIGSQLVIAGLQQLQARGYPFAVVLGEPAFYRRFGFVTATDYGVDCDYDVPADAFMIQVWDQDALANVVGRARYRPEFTAVG